MEGRRVQNLTGPHSRYARRADQALGVSHGICNQPYGCHPGVGWNFPEQGREQVLIRLGGGIGDVM
jgi:hypothetical protein